jgi:hypothetical protein
MATGYTYNVVEGKTTEFKDFLLQCARAFGACIMQRDDDITEHPKLSFVDDYHLNCWKQAKENLERAESESLERFTERKKISIKKKHDYLVEYEKEKQIQKDRLEKMLESVRAWTPPTADHENLKSFMIDQLKETMRYDGNVNPVPEIDYDQDYAQLREEHIQYLKRDVEYHYNKYIEEVETVTKRNEWIAKLYESVK